ncbi:DUF4240 domain-containing protein [Kitasatospora sp. NPDC057198]|uniref:DUF4240 domain-containing protein n=1 Tax=Kitasatospora sp. NPDC057198 TaxID=3346046 RepID=UPI00363EC365
MDTDEFWTLIEQARGPQADPAAHQDPEDGEAVAARAVALLAARPVAEILAAERVLDRLLADSYLAPLWGAAYLLNGGCSDDGFDYFRGWLVLRGRAVFERALADPDALADLPAVRAAVAAGADLDGEEALSLAWDAHLAATGAEPPASRRAVPLPELDPEWNFDFDDHEELSRRLPRLARLCAERDG